MLRPSASASGSIAKPADARWRDSMLTTEETVQTRRIAATLTPNTARASTAAAAAFARPCRKHDEQHATRQTRQAQPEHVLREAVNRDA